MKKILAFTAAFVLLFSSAVADSVFEFQLHWDPASKMYGAQNILSDMITYNEDSVEVTGEGWKMTLIPAEDHIDQAVIYAPDANTMLPLGACLGFTFRPMIGDTDYLGMLLMLFLNVSSGRPVMKAKVDEYICSMEKTEDGYMYSMALEATDP